MKISNINSLVCFLVLTCYLRSFAQQSEPALITTDRPSVGTGTDVIPPGSQQVESGLTWAHSIATNAFDGPEALFRVGVINRVEFHLATSNMNGSVGQSGMSFGDVAIGSKVNVSPSGSKWPVSVDGSLSFPTGSKALTSGGTDPTALVTVSHNFTSKLSFFSSGTLASLSTPGAGRAVNSQLAADLGWCPNPKTCFFVEAAPFVSSAQGSSGYTLDGGMTWDLTRVVQLDWRLASTTQAGTHTTLLSVGYSRRRDR
jgi:hypothetical protein